MNSIEGQEVIKFYRADRPYGFLSNLYKKPIALKQVIEALIRENKQ